MPGLARVIQRISNLLVCVSLGPLGAVNVFARYIELRFGGVPGLNFMVPLDPDLRGSGNMHCLRHVSRRNAQVVGPAATYALVTVIFYSAGTVLLDPMDAPT